MKNTMFFMVRINKTYLKIVTFLYLAFGLLAIRIDMIYTKIVHVYAKNRIPAGRGYKP